MNYLKLIKDPKDGYLVVENNDEKLLVLADLILNKELVAQLKENFHTFNTITSLDKQFIINRETNDLLIIRYYKKNETLAEEDNPLEIEITPDSLEYILEEVLERINNNTQEITLAREMDEYSIYS